MNKLTAYYAHFMGIYNTPCEARDMQTLQRLGLKIINPNTQDTQKFVEYCLGDGDDYETMFQKVFLAKIDLAEVFVFRGLADGKIPAGVAKELLYAQKTGKIILELPCGVNSRSMSVDETREYLQDMGQR